MKRNEPSELCLPKVMSKKSYSEIHAWYWHTLYDLGWSRLSKCTWPTIKWNTVITLFSGTVFHPLSCGMVCLFMFKNHDTGVSGWIFYILTDEKVVSWTKQNGSLSVNGHEKLCHKTTTKDAFHFVWINCVWEEMCSETHSAMIGPASGLLISNVCRKFPGQTTYARLP